MDIKENLWLVNEEKYIFGLELVANDQVLKQELEELELEGKVDRCNLGYCLKHSIAAELEIEVREILKLIKEIDNYGEMIDISFLTESKIRYFYSEIQRSDRFRIERFNNIEKKYAYLAMFLYFRRKELVDMVIAVTSHYANTVMKRSKKKTQNL